MEWLEKLEEEAEAVEEAAMLVIKVARAKLTRLRK